MVRVDFVSCDGTIALSTTYRDMGRGRIAAERARGALLGGRQAIPILAERPGEPSCFIAAAKIRSIELIPFEQREPLAGMQRLHTFDNRARASGERDDS